MPRVLLAAFCAVPDTDRAGVQIPHALRALADQHAVEVLTLREGGSPYVEHFRNTRMLRVPVPRASLRERIAAFRRALRRQVEGADYAAVHCCDTWSAAPILELRERYGFRLIYDPARRPWLDLDDVLGRERKVDDQACVREADLVLAPTASAARDFEALGAREVRVVPPGVDVDSFDWDAMPAGDSPEILYVGPVRAGAGIELLVRAMKDVRAQVPARLRLLGRVAPDFEPVLERHIEALGLGSCVTVDPPIDNGLVPRAIAGAALCVAPRADAARDGSACCPTKLLEYLACKRPAVAPRRQTVASVLDDGEHVLLFAPNDPADLAARMLRLLGDPGLAAAIAEAGYRLVRDRRPASATRRALRAAYSLLELTVPALERRSTRSQSEDDGFIHEVSESQLEVLDGDLVNARLAPSANDQAHAPAAVPEGDSSEAGAPDSAVTTVAPAHRAAGPGDQLTGNAPPRAAGPSGRRAPEAPLESRDEVGTNPGL